MLLTLGLSPALQRVMLFDRFQTGEVNRAKQTLTCAAGKAINAARAARIYSPNIQLGVVGPLGGATGLLCEGELESRAIGWASVEDAPDTRTCTTILDRASGQVTELVEESPKLTVAQLNDALSKLALPRLLLCAGSLSPDAPDDFYAAAAGRCEPETLLVDAKRVSLLTAMRIQACANRIAKLNAAEALETTGAADLPSAIRFLHAAGATHVVITDGAREVHASDGKYRSSYAPPKVIPLNTTGCGDCLTGVLAASLLAGQSFFSAVKEAIAASAASAETLLPSDFDPARARALSAL